MVGVVFVIMLCLFFVGIGLFFVEGVLGEVELLLM